MKQWCKTSFIMQTMITVFPKVSKARIELILIITNYMIQQVSNYNSVNGKFWPNFDPPKLPEVYSWDNLRYYRRYGLIRFPASQTYWEDNKVRFCWGEYSGGDTIPKFCRTAGQGVRAEVDFWWHHIKYPNPKDEYWFKEWCVYKYCAYDMEADSWVYVPTRENEGLSQWSFCPGECASSDDDGTTSSTHPPATTTRRIPPTTTPPLSTSLRPLPSPPSSTPSTPSTTTPDDDGSPGDDGSDIVETTTSPSSTTTPRVTTPQHNIIPPPEDGKVLAVVRSARSIPIAGVESVEPRYRYVSVQTGTRWYYADPMAIVTMTDLPIRLAAGVYNLIMHYHVNLSAPVELQLVTKTTSAAGKVVQETFPLISWLGTNNTTTHGSHSIEFKTMSFGLLQLNASGTTAPSVHVRVNLLIKKKLDEMDWVEDLTEEGVEPNPGPPLPTQIRSAVKTLVKELDMAIIYASILGLPLSPNRFNSLTVHDDPPMDGDFWDSDSDGRVREAVEKWKPRQIVGSADSRDELKRHAKSVVKNKIDPATNTGHTYHTSEAMVTRLADVLRAKPILWCKYVGLRQEGTFEPTLRRATIRKLAQACWGEGWDKKVDLDEAGFLVYAYLENVSPDCVRSTFLETIVAAGAKSTHKNTRFPDLGRLRMDDDGQYVLLEEDGGYDLVKSAMHNKIMHISNGNIFSRGMGDVDKARSTTDFLSPETLLSAPLLNPAAWLSMVMGDRTDLSPRSTITRDFMGLIGRQIDEASNMTSNNVLPLPCSYLTPANEWFGATNNLATDALRYYRCPAFVSSVNYLSARLLKYYYNLLSPTKRFAELQTIFTSTFQTKVRANDHVVSGYAMDDVMQLFATVNGEGLSLETMLLKLMLLLDIYRSSTTVVDIPNIVYSTFSYPMATQVGPGDVTADNTTAHDPYNNNPTLLVCNPPILYETDPARANDPNAQQVNGAYVHEFPFGGGNGWLSFHVSMATVPTDEKPYVVYVPQAVLNCVGANMSSTLALLIASITAWPFGLYGVRRDTRPTVAVGATADGMLNNTTFVHHASLVDIPGAQILHVILPRTVQSGPPTDAANAGRNLVFHPTTGPAAVGTMAAGAEVTINHLGNEAVNRVSMVDYLLTWATSWNVNVISSYITQLTLQLGESSTIPAIVDMVSWLTMRFAPHIPLASHDEYMNQLSRVDRVGEEPVSYESTLPPYKQLTPWGCEPPSVTPSGKTRVGGQCDRIAVHFPFRLARRQHFVLYEMNLINWNKVVLGLAEQTDRVYTNVANTSGEFTHAQSVMWKIFRSLAHASGWQMYYHMMGISAEAWNAGLSDVAVSPNITELVQMTFAAVYHVGNLQKPPAMAGWRNIAAGCFGFRLPEMVLVAPEGRTLPIDMLDRLLKPEHIVGVRDLYPKKKPKTYFVEWNNMYTPTILLDSWYQYFALDLPKAYMSFPPPGGFDSTYGYDTRSAGTPMDLMRCATSVVGIHAAMEYPHGVVSNVECPQMDDHTIWNRRLLWTDATQSVCRTNSGQAFPDELRFIHQIYHPTFRGVTRQSGILLWRYPGRAVNPTHPNDVWGLDTANLPVMTLDGYVVYVWAEADAPAVKAKYMRIMNRTESIDKAAWLLGDANYKPQYVSTLNRTSRWQRLAATASKASGFGDDASVAKTQPNPAPPATQAPQVVRPDKTVVVDPQAGGGVNPPGPPLDVTLAGVSITPNPADALTKLTQ